MKEVSKELNKFYSIQIILYLCFLITCNNKIFFSKYVKYGCILGCGQNFHQLETVNLDSF